LRTLLLVLGGGLVVVLIATALISPKAGEGPPEGRLSDAPVKEPTADAQLFSPTSFWNTRLEADAPVDPRSGSVVAALSEEVKRELASGVGPWIATRQCSTPLYLVPRQQPTLRVGLTHPNVFWRKGLARAFRRVPLPVTARPANCVDLHLTVWQPATNRLWEFFHLRKEDGNWEADWGGAMKHVSQSSGFYAKDSWPGLSAPNWGATGTSLSVIGGVMLLRELRAGDVDHALAMNVPEARAGVFSWPAQRSDGIGPSMAIPEGARLRLDPTLDLTSLDLPPLTLTIARAAQRYGVVVRDQTGSSNGIALFGEDPTRWKGDPYRGKSGFFGNETPDQLLSSFPWDSLQLLRLDLCRRAPCRRS
jgi:hypothetical protein